MKMKKTIYFDMDGVLANFDKAVKQAEIPQPWLNIPGFFSQLEPIGDPDKTIKALKEKGYTVYILSKVEVRDNTERAKNKKEWISKFLPSVKEEDIIIVPIHEEKTAYIKSDIKDSILIDDYKGNLIEWQEKGGTAVKFGNKIKETRPYHQIVNSIAGIFNLLKEIEG